MGEPAAEKKQVSQTRARTATPGGGRDFGGLDEGVVDAAEGKVELEEAEVAEEVR